MDYQTTSTDYVWQYNPEMSKSYSLLSILSTQLKVIPQGDPLPSIFGGYAGTTKLAQSCPFTRDVAEPELSCVDEFYFRSRGPPQV